MITAAQLYWITRLDGLCILFGVCAWLALLASLFFLTSVYGDGREEHKRAVLVAFGCTTVFVFLAIFTPTTKEAAAIYLIPKIANNEKVKEIPSKFLSLADEWLEELRPKKK